MKRLILLVALLIFALPAFGQLRVFTENDYNQYRHYAAATAANGDTVVNVIGAQTPGQTVLPYLVAVVFNTMATSATMVILDGANTVASITLPATAITQPVIVPFGLRMTTSLVVKITATNDVTLIYRTWR